MAKDSSIQSLRGVAVLLMVAGHVIGTTPENGLGVADDSAWRVFYLALEDVRMPLFTVISGYVYAMRPISVPAEYPEMVRAKVRRLLAPLLTVGLLMFAMELAVPGADERLGVTELWRVFVLPYEHLWFLQAVFVIFLVVGGLELLGLLRTPARSLATIVAATCLFQLLPVHDSANVFSIANAELLLPFFLLGSHLRRFGGDALTRAPWAALAVVVALVLLPLRELITFGLWHPSVDAERATSLLIGFSGVIALFAVRRAIVWRPLAWIGGFAFGIYLLHVPAASVTRRLLAELGVASTPLAFAVVMTAAVAAPVALQRLTRSSRVVQTWVFGEKSRTRSAEPAVPR